MLGNGAQISRRVLRHPLRGRITSPYTTPTKFRRRKPPTAPGSQISGCMAISSCSNSAKMSKSSGEFLRVQQLLIDKVTIRSLIGTFVLTAHYRSQLTFSWDALDARRRRWSGLQHRARPRRTINCGPDFVGRFMAMLNDDLNFPQALALTYEMLKSDLGAGREESHLAQVRRSVRSWTCGLGTQGRGCFQPTCARCRCTLGGLQRQRLAGS